MIKIEHTETYGWDAAIRGMRNPLNSWERSDSFNAGLFGTVVGENDHDLMMRLAKGGAVHAKYRRMITVTCDITAPLYWWKEFDTYKVGTVANSCSTMHKIHTKPFCRDDFSHDRLDEGGLALLDTTIAYLEAERQKFLSDKENLQHWHNMIQSLPSSYNQKRTVQLTYEVLVAMYRDRQNHKLDEWHTLCDWIRELPYSEIIIGG